jgi:hypothetical protein
LQESKRVTIFFVCTPSKDDPNDGLNDTERDVADAFAVMGLHKHWPSVVADDRSLAAIEFLVVVAMSKGLQGPITSSVTADDNLQSIIRRHWDLMPEDQPCILVVADRETIIKIVPPRRADDIRELDHDFTEFRVEVDGSGQVTGFPIMASSPFPRPEVLAQTDRQALLNEGRPAAP